MIILSEAYTGGKTPRRGSFLQHLKDNLGTYALGGITLGTLGVLGSNLKDARTNAIGSYIKYLDAAKTYKQLNSEADILSKSML